MHAPRYSLVIPVYNSAPLLEETVTRCLAVLDALPGGHELILVNDCSRDASWELARRLAVTHPGVQALDLTTNVGQHGALLLGLRRATGDRIVTLDDDGQNPPEEIVHLAARADEGHDLVFGRFRFKRHSSVRVAGSRLVTRLNRWLYGLPGDMVVSNFRLIDRTIVDRLCRTNVRRPYLTGLALQHATHPANARVEHHSRTVGSGNYGPRQIATLLATILLSHPTFPWAGARRGALSLAIAGSLLVLGTLDDRGWLTLIGLAALTLGIATWRGLRSMDRLPQLDDTLIREVVEASPPTTTAAPAVPEVQALRQRHRSPS